MLYLRHGFDILKLFGPREKHWILTFPGRLLVASERNLRLPPLCVGGLRLMHEDERDEN